MDKNCLLKDYAREREEFLERVKMTMEKSIAGLVYFFTNPVGETWALQKDEDGKVYSWAVTREIRFEP